MPTAWGRPVPPAAALHLARERLLPFQAAGKQDHEGRSWVSIGDALELGHFEEPSLNESCCPRGKVALLREPSAHM